MSGREAAGHRQFPSIPNNSRSRGVESRPTGQLIPLARLTCTAVKEARQSPQSPQEPQGQPDAPQTRLRSRSVLQALNQACSMVILMTMTILSLAEVKSHLSELVGRVNSQHERVTVTVHGKPSAVLIATEDLESLEETIAILSDPEVLNRLASSEAELVRGEGESEEQLAQAMNERHRQRA